MAYKSPGGPGPGWPRVIVMVGYRPRFVVLAVIIALS